MVSARQGSTTLTLTELQKAISVKFIGVWIDSFIQMSGNGGNGDMCASGNSDTIGKCERAQREADPSHWKDGTRTSAFRVMLKKESNKQRAGSSSRWDSRRKLSILCILSIPAFVQPSSLITASTSWRRGSIYSGFARRRYNAWVNVY